MRTTILSLFVVGALVYSEFATADIVTAASITYTGTASEEGAVQSRTLECGEFRVDFHAAAKNPHMRTPLC